MHLEINDKTSLRDIQLVFSDFYPYLKIEFYRKRHKKYEASDEAFQIDPNICIGDIKHTHVTGLLEIRPLYKVADVENEFQQRFGLSVQILRKEKEGWQQTTGMDDFTLKELNEIGRNSSDEFIVSDYEEGFEESEEKPEKLL
ncbi:MAG: hypothetical protein Q8941_02230 [Bacteroidota bacterium]|nr:hypothetical protein [Bacteroidota bacterium]